MNELLLFETNLLLIVSGYRWQMTSNLYLLGKEFPLRLMNSILWESQRKMCWLLHLDWRAVFLFRIPIKSNRKNYNNSTFYFLPNAMTFLGCFFLAFTVCIRIQLHSLLRLHDLIAISEVSK